MFTVHGQNNTTIGIASSTISRVLTPSHHLTSTPIVMPSTTSNIKPTPTTTVSSVTVTVRHTTSNVSTVPTPGSSSTPTSKPGNHSTTVPTTNVKPSPVTPSPKGRSFSLAVQKVLIGIPITGNAEVNVSRVDY